MYTSKLKIKNAFNERMNESLLISGFLKLSGGNQFHIAGPATEKPADHNCWDDGEARREDLGWQSKDVV